ncbi:MAG: ATP-binding protein [Nitrososphaerota archaeon]
MVVQLYAIKGNTAEILFNPKEDKMDVGRSLILSEYGSNKGIVVQALEFQTFAYPSKTEEQIREMMEMSYNPPGGTTQVYETTGILEAKDLELCRAKIRRTITEDGNWEDWDGWIPTRNVETKLIEDSEVYQKTVLDFGNMLHLGHDQNNTVFGIDGRNFEKINIITSAKGMGKSHLAKVLIIELIRKSKPCIVFDINNEYIRLGESQELAGRVHVLRPGDNFRISVEDFGIEPLISLLRVFQTTENTIQEFETYWRRLMADRRRSQTPPGFLSIQSLIDAADRGQVSTNNYVTAAISRKLNNINRLGFFARNPQENTSIDNIYNNISQNGGLIVVSILSVSVLVREGLVNAIIEKIKSICGTVKAIGGNNFPFVFFEEAHSYITREGITDIVTRARHFGITSTFVTNMVTELADVIMRQIDNLFILNLPFSEDVKHVSKSSITDEDTVEAFAQRLGLGEAMVVGNATSRYPIIFKTDRAEGFNLLGETMYSFSRP